MNLGDWLKIMVGAGLGTAAVQAIAKYLTERRSKKAKADFLALQIAIVLENFADRCADLVHENRYTYQAPDHEFPDWSILLPEIDIYPDDVDGWRSLEQNLVGRCLNLRYDRDAAQRNLNEIVNHVPHETEEYVALAAEKVGVAALKLAGKLRSGHGVMASQLDTDAEDRLTGRANWARAEIEKREKRQASIPLPYGDQSTS